MTEPSSSSSTTSTPSAGVLLDDALDAADHDDDARAADLVTRCLEAATAAGDDEMTVRCLVLQATLHTRAGRYVAAARAVEDARHAADAAGAHSLGALVDLSAARLAMHAGDTTGAVQLLEAAWEVLRGEPPNRARIECQNLLGVILLDLGHLDSATTTMERAVQEAAENGHPVLANWAAVNLASRWLDIGELRSRRGDEAGARQAWETGVQANDALTEQLLALPRAAPRDLTYCRLHRAECLERLGRDSEALAAFGEVRATARGAVFAHALVGLHRDIARILMRRGDLEGARREIDEGLQRAAALGLKVQEMKLREVASQAAELTGDPERALTHYRRFHALAEEVIEQARPSGHALSARLDSQLTLEETEVHRARATALDATNHTLAALADHLEEVANADPLTGLANRRRLDSDLLVAHQHALAAGEPLCVALLDLDHFKVVNDRFGHPTGDEVLRLVAEHLRRGCRPHDLVARAGGEEFVMVFGGMNLQDTARICERLRAGIEHHPWRLLGDGLGVTVSVGVCDIAGYSDLATGLLRADALLYRAKAEGRNRVAVDDARWMPLGGDVRD